MIAKKVSPFIERSLNDFYKGDKDDFIERYSYIEEVIARIPKYSTIDPATACELANMTLAAAYACAELIHEVSRESGSIETMTKAEEADAYYRSKSSSAIMKKIDSQKDEEYVKIQQTLNASKSFLDFLRREYDVLVKQHHLCKELIKGGQGLHATDAMGGASVEDLL